MKPSWNHSDNIEVIIELIFSNRLSTTDLAECVKATNKKTIDNKTCNQKLDEVKSIPNIGDISLKILNA